MCLCMKIIREVYLYSDTHLPTHGWLQGCWECEIITSRLKAYKTVTKGRCIYKFIVYLCPLCKRLINTKAESKSCFFKSNNQ